MIASNNMMVSEQRILRCVDGSGRDSVFKLARHLSGGTEEIHINVRRVGVPVEISERQGVCLGGGVAQSVYWMDGWDIRFRLPAGTAGFYFQRNIQSGQGAHSLLLIRHREFFVLWSTGRGVKFATFLHLVLRLRLYGVIPPRTWHRGVVLNLTHERRLGCTPTEYSPFWAL